MEKAAGCKFGVCVRTELSVASQINYSAPNEHAINFKFRSLTPNKSFASFKTQVNTILPKAYTRSNKFERVAKSEFVSVRL